MINLGYVTHSDGSVSIRRYKKVMPEAFTLEERIVDFMPYVLLRSIRLQERLSQSGYKVVGYKYKMSLKRQIRYIDEVGPGLFLSSKNSHYLVATEDIDVYSKMSDEELLLVVMKDRGLM